MDVKAWAALGNVQFRYAHLSGRNWAWDGTYSFSRNSDED